MLTDLCKGISSPLLVLWLSSQLDLDGWQSGALLGGAMLLATGISLPGGVAFDRRAKVPIILFALLSLAAAIFLLPYTHTVILAAVLLVLMESGAAVFGIGIKALLAVYLDVDKRAFAFSLRYILTNVAFAIGPLLGIQLAASSLEIAFGLAAVSGLLGALVLARLPNPATEAKRCSPIAPAFKLHQVLKVLSQDRNLIIFTAGSFFNAMVHGRFTFFLSLLLLHKYPTSLGMELLSGVLLTNALVVIFLQGVISRYIYRGSLKTTLLAGVSLFVIGLMGFAVSDSLLAWCFSMLFFTLGETLIQPAEYLYIDEISPDEMKGAYFAVHNLAGLGAAVSPIWCGVAISTLGPEGLCFSLVGCILMGGGLCMHAIRPARSKPITH
ncbi:MFS transporter [Pseudomonas graminis]|uniref:MFS transporter n=1 Tax=Pseudomonas graminis TaxID=158627 RepID=UPI00234B65B0|nr:MFS transporter [Pseudomonas graminis]MDC6382026.1 MFS transporter [Pseudomonas graminis]